MPTPSIDADALAAETRAGDRRALSRAITLVESSRPDDRAAANRLLELLTPLAGRSIRVGVSGAPGVGKSTFIEALGNHVIDERHKVAVLAVDPSSTLSGGSILGDKTRMEMLGRRAEAFIRPSPTGGTLGGVTRNTREAIVVTEAAGFDVVLVETVGVGQSETAVADLTDVFVLLLLPAGGDELQGIKRGIVERADVIVVNKADGELEAAATRAATDYRAALRLLHARVAGWEVPVLTCSSLSRQGIPEVWATIRRFQAHVVANGSFSTHRAEQARACLWAEMAATLVEGLQENAQLRARSDAIEAAVGRGEVSARVAARQLVNDYLAARKPPI
jgi:LAO/AO transport system kinase